VLNPKVPLDKVPSLYSLSQSDLFEGFDTDGVPAACESSRPTGNGAGQSGDYFFDLQQHLDRVPAKANQAMVVLMRGIRCNFKQVIGYFLSANTMNGDCLKQEAQLPQRNSVSAVHVDLGWLTDRAMHRTPQNRRGCRPPISDIQFKRSDSRSAGRKRILS